LERVTFDRYPAVKRDGDLMIRLQGVVEAKGKKIAWAPGKWEPDPLKVNDQVKRTLRSDLLCAIETIMPPHRD